MIPGGGPRLTAPSSRGRTFGATERLPSLVKGRVGVGSNDVAVRQCLLYDVGKMSQLNPAFQPPSTTNSEPVE